MKKLITNDRIGDFYREEEYALVANPEGMYPAAEILPLAARNPTPDDLHTVVSDMDGTATTTENLCLHSLEYMLRKITDRMDPERWKGLDRKSDYPHIIGNSTTRHVEYLLERYKDPISDNAFAVAFLEAVVWFEHYGKDRQRLDEVRLNCRMSASQDLLVELQNCPWSAGPQFLQDQAKKVSLDTPAKKVRAAVDIYYRRYHEILMAINTNAAVPENAMLGEISRDSLILPMPGLAFFLLLIKGFLDNADVLKMLPRLKKDYYEKSGREYRETDETIAAKLYSLSKRFREKPLRLALVTSSISYEADIVMRQVFRKMYRDCENWPLKDQKIRHLLTAFRDYRELYDVVVTASDSHEIRLKPHRDLYSIALNRMHVNRENLDAVIGFEDSESGIVALRAAGVGCAVALPFHETEGHDLSAAAHIVKGGLPEVLMQHGCFLRGEN
ncbi:MAG: hypothetical protein U5N56_08635 [Candidatus Marinimicrobia bacterium]|nr:hypothetical protein [Candidatus Neomarinimicrobiota bacterium]